MAVSDRVRVVLVAVLAPIAAQLAVASSAANGKFTTLYEGVDEATSGALRVVLEKRHIPFKLEDGGQTVLVPASRCAELKLELVHYFLPGTLYPLAGFPHAYEWKREHETSRGMTRSRL